MLQSPFTFYRGSAGVMAADLGRTPVSGLHVQVCGDCHLMNFGGCATPERRLIFDIDDLDETLPAPWEWDVKRLVASFVLAARANGLSDAQGRDAAVACARSYRRKMRDFTTMDVLASHAAGNIEMIRECFTPYRETLAEDRRVLLDRYQLVDAAIKVVGIGSVGTLCMVALMMSVADTPLFLQFKQVNASVLEAYAGKSVYPNHGQRVVMGQRLMQPASDLFLGWVIGPEGRHFYIRQLRDVKLSPLVETYDAEMFSIYGELCGWALARAHAKAGDPWAISGYLGRKSDQFDQAMGKFALAYADQAERDHAALKSAVRAGTVEVQLEH
jgi:uncharacterized protein (DUF2252 family)